MTDKPKKRIDIVTVKMVKESSMLYADRVIRSPQCAANLISEYVGNVDREHFVVLCLSTKNEPTNITTAHIGSLNASVCHPREILKTAILSNAAGIIISHTHPSGSPRESEEDILVTERIHEACKIIGIDLIDHLIIGIGDGNGDVKFNSLKEKGII